MRWHDESQWGANVSSRIGIRLSDSTKGMGNHKWVLCCGPSRQIWAEISVYLVHATAARSAAKIFRPLIRTLWKYVSFSSFWCIFLWLNYWYLGRIPIGVKVQNGPNVKRRRRSPGNPLCFGSVAFEDWHAASKVNWSTHIQRLKSVGS